MEKIALESYGGICLLASAAIFGFTYGFYLLLANHRWRYTYTLCVGMSGFIPLWMAWRAPSSIALGPGVVELRYPVRLTRRFKTSEVSAAIEFHQALYGDPESWSVRLNLPGGDQVYLVEKPTQAEAAAFADKVQGKAPAAEPPAEASPSGP